MEKDKNDMENLICNFEYEADQDFLQLQSPVQD